MIKYSILNNHLEVNNHQLSQIIALRDIYDAQGNLVVSKGSLGGYLEGEHNLSQSGGCWIMPNSYVYGSSQVSGDQIIDNSKTAKYVLTDEHIEINNQKLYRIKALKSFSDISAGDLGGYVASEDNLSQQGNAWVYDEAIVMDNAKVGKNGQVFGHSIIRDEATIYGVVHDNSIVSNNAIIDEGAMIENHSIIKDDAIINAGVIVKDYGTVINKSKLQGKLIVEDMAVIDTQINNNHYSVFGGYQIYRGNYDERYYDYSFSLKENLIKILIQIIMLVGFLFISYELIAPSLNVVLAVQDYRFSFIAGIILIVIGSFLTLFNIIKSLTYTYYLYTKDMMANKLVKLQLHRKYNLSTYLLFIKLLIILIMLFLILM